MRRTTATLGSLLFLIVAPGVVHLFVVAYEDPTLRRRYGDQYDAYCARVRRWLPRITPAADLRGKPSP